MSRDRYTVGQTVWFERDDKRWSTGEYVGIAEADFDDLFKTEN
jgi:hypothetical protein